MKSAQLIYIMGDVHGDWQRLNKFINVKIRQNKRLRKLAAVYDTVEVLILQCGDFGYWPHTDATHSYFPAETLCDDGDPYAIKNSVPFIKDGKVKIYWCEGNHENHDALDVLKSLYPDTPFIPVMPEIYYACFGSVLTLLDGTTVMFCGGAASDDKELRELGTEWWAQETIDEEDMKNLPHPQKMRVDWIISHTSPTSFKITSDRLRHSKEEDGSRKYLDWILHTFTPTAWWHGHYHLYEVGVFQNCAWVCLGAIGHSQKSFEVRLLTLANGE